MKSTEITESARGEECTFQIVGTCNHDPETTVFCHLKFDKGGMGMKPCDLSGAYGCSSCHDAIDNRVHSLELESDRPFYEARALYRTHVRLWEKGIFSLRGAK